GERAEQDRLLRADAGRQPGEPDRPFGPGQRVQEGRARRGRGGGAREVRGGARGRGQRVPASRGGPDQARAGGRGSGGLRDGHRAGREVRAQRYGRGPQARAGPAARV
ncbi:MAG: hypothetical protein AVDCRST_MAG02-1380, partial [uncultured Rubrobacteraceae bacterium]